MSEVPNIRVRKGFDIHLVGEAEKQVADMPFPVTVGLKPTDFPNLGRPKLLVAQGDTVKAGTPLFFDKNQPDVQYCAPVSGEIVRVLRGEKRKLLEITVLADKKVLYEPLATHSLEEIGTLDREIIAKQLAVSGAFPHILQRPYGTVPNPYEPPKAIFISAFDSHPLAPSDTFALAQDREVFEAGITALKRLTSGDVYIGLQKGVDASYLSEQEGVHYYYVRGPHPAGNVGVHIHHLKPIGKEDIIWTTTPFGAVQLGRVLRHGRYDTRMRVALTGPEVLQPQYYQTYVGGAIKYMVKDNLRTRNVRYISGNVLTGHRVSEDDHLGYYHKALTVIAEGNYREAFGWLLPSISKLSFHRGFGLFSFLFPNKRHILDTNMHGEPRSFVQTGVLERVMPMDILPTHLIKAILAEDYDEMEALGIYEVVEEDLALCEFVDLSKHEIQHILRNGLNLIQNG